MTDLITEQVGSLRTRVQVLEATLDPENYQSIESRVAALESVDTSSLTQIPELTLRVDSVEENLPENLPSRLEAVENALVNVVGENYYPTLAQGVAATDVDDVFTSDPFGVRAVYLRTSSAPFYQFQRLADSNSMNLTNSLSGGDGRLFNTAGADDFSQLLHTPHGSLTLTANQAAFSSPTTRDIILSIPAPDGVNPLLACFDQFTMRAKVTIDDFPVAGVDGAFIAARFYDIVTSDAMYGMRIAAGGSSTDATLISAVVGNAVLAHTLNHTGLPKTIDISYTHDFYANQVVHRAAVDGGPVSALTHSYGGGSLVPPVRAMSGVLRFQHGNIIVSEFEWFTPYVNPLMIFAGDSLTLGASATPISSGFAPLIKAAHPGQIGIAGASGSTSEDWIKIIDSVLKLKPKFVPICLTVNDRVLGWPVSRSQAAMQTVISKIVVAGAKPILISAPPTGHANTESMNTWLASRGFQFINIYSLLVGSGYALQGGFNAGDGIHWTNSAHDAVRNFIESEFNRLGVYSMFSDGLILDSDPGLTANSDVRIPTQKAIKAYIDAQIAASA